MTITYCFLHLLHRCKRPQHGLDLAQVRKGLVCKIRTLSFQNSCAHRQRTAHCHTNQRQPSPTNHGHRNRANFHLTLEPRSEREPFNFRDLRRVRNPRAFHPKIVRQVCELRIPWWQDHANRLRLDIGRIAARYEESTAEVSSSVRGRFRNDV